MLAPRLVVARNFGYFSYEVADKGRSFNYALLTSPMSS
jgi:hypothetical protein